MTENGVITFSMQRIQGNTPHVTVDTIAIEEPLEILLGATQDGDYTHRSLSITMRTPGQDRDLAAGFLLTEGLISHPDEIVQIIPWGRAHGESAYHNIIRVDLDPKTHLDFERLQRHFYTTSSCGVCGKTSIQALNAVRDLMLPHSHTQIASETIHNLPHQLRKAQDLFERTGGIHAAAIFDANGVLLALREDIGRHNAVDKVIGALFLENKLPLADHVLFVSGRASFELMQKALMAGISTLAAVGAPSSLAVQLARDSNATLLGFVRNDRFNLYSGAHRILEANQENINE